jgi:hypothetical protein
MMPIMTSALRTLTHHEVARGSTLVNILQQIGGSIGAAVMSVILTSNLNNAPKVPGMLNPQTGEPVSIADVAILSHDSVQGPAIVKQVPPDLIDRGLAFVADSYASTYWVGFALVLATFIPIAFLPRKREVSRLAEDEAGATPVVLH